jgi:hypothetical protein
MRCGADLNERRCGGFDCGNAQNDERPAQPVLLRRSVLRMRPMSLPEPMPPRLRRSTIDRGRRSSTMNPWPYLTGWRRDSRTRHTGASVTRRPTTVSWFLVVFDDFEVPDGKPDFTPTGKPRVRKLNKTERNDLCREAVSAITINAARRALAASPGSEEATVVAFRDGLWEPIAWLRLRRGQEAGWRLSALSELIGSEARMSTKGRTREIAAADFAAWPELGEFVEAIWLRSAGLDTPDPETVFVEDVSVRMLP